MNDVQERLKELYFKLIRVEAFASVSDEKLVKELRDAKEICSDILNRTEKDDSD